MLSEALAFPWPTLRVRALLLFGMPARASPADAPPSLRCYSKELVRSGASWSPSSPSDGGRRVAVRGPCRSSGTRTRSEMRILSTTSASRRGDPASQLVSLTWVAVGGFNAQRGETGALAALRSSKC